MFTLSIWRSFWRLCDLWYVILFIVFVLVELGVKQFEWILWLTEGSSASMFSRSVHLNAHYEVNYLNYYASWRHKTRTGTFQCDEHFYHVDQQILYKTLVGSALMKRTRKVLAAAAIRGTCLSLVLTYVWHTHVCSYIRIISLYPYSGCNTSRNKAQ